MAEAASGKVAFDLVSPEKVLAEHEADMVVVPGEEGDFGVLAQHAPVLSLLRPGIVSVYEGNQVVESFFVEGGFAEANPTGLTVLAEAAVPLAELTVDGARARLRDAEEDLADTKAPSDTELARLERAVVVARARVEAAEGRGA
jgi:F-type H+-transporting ATPase subunit epsilon